MARIKNRAKKLKESINSSQPKIFKMGGYVRKSVVDDSIENQKLFIQDYINDSEDLILHSFYEDNGKTGTNFTRSGFESMMNDVRTGVIDGIIVKDITRFGREHLIIGDYIEKVFPFLGVRFISILDRYDTIMPGCSKEILTIKLKSLIGELYSLDISKKVKGTAKIKAEKGECYGNNSLSYGLRVKPGEKIPEVDYRPAKIIRKIIGWYLGGASNQIIRYKLYNRRIASPGQYKRIGSVYVPKNMEVEFWGKTSIDTVLTNIEYTGIRVTHKTDESLYDGIKKHEVPENERIYIPNAFPSIIRMDIYDIVQKTRVERKKRFYKKKEEGILPYNSFEENIFTGLFYCGDCGASMGRRNTRIKKNNKFYNLKVFYCRAHMGNSRLCDAKTIKEIELLSIIRKLISTQIAQVQDALCMLDTLCHGCFANELNDIEESINDTKKNELLLMHGKTENLLRYQTGEIDKSEFLKMRNKIADEKKFLSLREAALNKRKGYLIKINSYLLKMAKEILVYENIINQKEEDYKVVTKELLTAFIEKIYLYPNNRIVVTMRYQDLLDHCIGMLNEIQGG